jgi:hypothetical protein
LRRRLPGLQRRTRLPGQGTQDNARVTHEQVELAIASLGAFWPRPSDRDANDSVSRGPNDRSLGIPLKMNDRHELSFADAWRHRGVRGRGTPAARTPRQLRHLKPLFGKVERSRHVFAGTSELCAPRGS